MPGMIERTGLLDFGIGLMAGLVRTHGPTFSDRDMRATHTAIAEAFEVVANGLGRAELDFVVITHKIYGTSHAVAGILQDWLDSDYATKDAPGTTYRFRMDKARADELLETLPGGAELYDKAAAALIESIKNHYTT